MRQRLSKTFLCIIDMIFVVVAFLIAAWIKPATVRIYIPNYWRPALLFMFVWVLVSFSGRKYHTFKERRYSSILSSILSSAFISSAIIAILMVAFKQLSYSRIIVFGTILNTVILEVSVSWAYYYSRKFIPLQPGDVPASHADVSNLINDMGYKPNTPIKEGIKKFTDWYLKFYEKK